MTVFLQEFAQHLKKSNAAEKAEHEAEERRRLSDFRENEQAWKEYPAVCRQLQEQKDATVAALKDGGREQEEKLCVQASLESLVEATGQNEAMLMATAIKLKEEVHVHEQCLRLCSCALCLYPCALCL